MQVVIEVISGATTGTKQVLQVGQQLTFGRTSWADVSFSSDGKMSGTHFSINNDGLSCLLQDTGSTNGTQLNGTFVKQAMLANNDQIKAGNTKFAISITGQPADGDGIERKKKTLVDGGLVPDVGRNVLAADNLSLAYFIESCTSSITACRHYPSIEEIDNADSADVEGPAIVFELLAQELKATLVVDYRKFGGTPPEIGPESKPLFHWLPLETAKSLSPWALSVTAPSQHTELIKAAWDNDALIAFFSDESSTEIIEHLSNQLRAPDAGPQDSMLGWCWPSVLSQLLAFRDQNFVEGLLGKCQAALVEIPDLPGGWQLFTAPNLGDDLLDKLGFSNLADQEEAPLKNEPAT